MHNIKSNKANIIKIITTEIRTFWSRSFEKFSGVKSILLGLHRLGPDVVDVVVVVVVVVFVVGVVFVVVVVDVVGVLLLLLLLWLLLSMWLLRENFPKFF